MFIRCDPGWARAHVYKRDEGVCAICGMDTDLLQRVLWKIRQSLLWEQMGWRARNGMHDWLYDLGFKPGQSLWEMDHIIPVSEGGGLCGLDNLRTLCVPCHKAETAALAKKRAKGGKAWTM